jgi:hypothetical protein
MGQVTSATSNSPHIEQKILSVAEEMQTAVKHLVENVEKSIKEGSIREKAAESGQVTGARLKAIDETLTEMRLTDKSIDRRELLPPADELGGEYLPPPATIACAPRKETRRSSELGRGKCRDCTI